MEFEGKEYSEGLIERVKEIYLTTPEFSTYPLIEELGISIKKATKLLGVVLPKPEVDTMEVFLSLYREYPSEVALKRVLRKSPVTLVLNDIVTLSTLEKLYTGKNLLLEDIIDRLGLPDFITPNRLKAFLKKRGIKRRPENIHLHKVEKSRNFYKDPLQAKKALEKSRHTSQERHGVDSASQLPETWDKIRSTNRERYNTDYGFQNEEVKKKSQQTKIKRYGTIYPQRLFETKLKAEQTNKERYGDTHVLKTPRGLEYQANTMLSRYGVANAKQIDISFTPTNYVTTIQESIQITEDQDTLMAFLKGTFPKQERFTLHEISDIVGRKYNFIASKFNTSLIFITPSRQGHLPERVQRFLEELGYTKGVDFLVNDREAIKPQEIDFYFPKQKVGIEVNDLWTHNSTVGPFGAEPKPKNYHMEKSRQAKEQGIRLIHAWEHYFNNPQQYEVLKNAIKHALGISKYRVYARNTYVKEVPNKDLKGFFNTNNIQGFRGAKTAYALFDKKTDEVLMAYSVGASHFAHNKYDMELIRGASKLDTTIVGGASKLWKFIIDSNPEVNSIVYYIDRNIYNGSSIGTLEGNLKLVSTQVGFWNYFVDTEEMKNRQPAKHKEIKELVAQGKVWEVYNAGTETYVWTRS